VKIRWLTFEIRSQEAPKSSSIIAQRKRDFRGQCEAESGKEKAGIPAQRAIEDWQGVIAANK
jgi:hypothetical protein